MVEKLIIRGPVAFETTHAELIGQSRFLPTYSVVRVLPRLVVYDERLLVGRRCWLLHVSILSRHVQLHRRRRLHVGGEVRIWQRAELLRMHLINLLLATDVGGERLHELWRRLRLHKIVATDAELRRLQVRRGSWQPALRLDLVMEWLLLMRLVFHLLSVKNIIIEAGCTNLD